MTQTLTGLFDSYDDARRAVQDLEAAGVSHRDISLMANDAHLERVVEGDHPPGAVGADPGAGAGLGAALGGVGGLLAGLGMVAIPGLGPVVAAGWLASTAAGALGGAVIGGAAGGMVGALTHAGVPEDDANVYAEGVRRGGTLVTAKVGEDLVPTARAILTDRSTVDLAQRRDLYRIQGWTRFDPNARPYTVDQIEADHRLHRL